MAATSMAPTIRIPQWTFSDRLRKVRRDILNASQQDLANQLNITKESYSAYESGRNQPRNVITFARHIEQLSNVPAYWLLGIDTPASAPPPGAPHDVNENITGRYTADNCKLIVASSQVSDLTTRLGSRPPIGGDHPCDVTSLGGRCGIPLKSGA